MAFRCRLSAAWTSWPLAPPDASGGPMPEAEGAVRAEERARVTPEAFPGRFNPLRGFPEAYEPLALVAGTALNRAGWWAPGSGAAVSGGLVVGVDRLFVAPMLRFGAQVRDRFDCHVSPLSFVESHPSTIPSFLGMLYGLPDYQTVVVRGSSSGGLALSHAVDALRTNRLERAVVVGVSGDASDRRVVAALCLDSTPGALDVSDGLPVALDIARDDSSSHGFGFGFGVNVDFDVDLLSALARWAARPEPRALTVSQTDDSFHETWTVSVEALIGG